jgi:hypothetical protein
LYDGGFYAIHNVRNSHQRSISFAKIRLVQAHLQRLAAIPYTSLSNSLIEAIMKTDPCSRSQQGRRSRCKGASGERELFHLLSEELGFLVTRNLTQTRDAGCDSLSVPGFAIECKRVETPFQKAWMAQAIAAIHPGHETPVVFYRQSRYPWRAAFRVSDLLQCYCRLQGPSAPGLAHLDFEAAVYVMRERLQERSRLPFLYPVTLGAIQR